jgi:hypothetical protein
VAKKPTQKQDKNMKTRAFNTTTQEQDWKSTYKNPNQKNQIVQEKTKLCA